MARPAESVTEIARRGARWRLWAAGFCAAVLPVAACSGGARHVAKAIAPVTTTAATTTTTVAPSITYKMTRGDTLGGVARRFGVSVAAIAGLNRIADPNKVRQGQALLIPPAPPTSKPASPTNTGAAGPAKLAVSPPQAPVGAVLNLKLTGARPTETVTFEIDSPNGGKFTGPGHTVAPDGSVSTYYVTTQGDPPGTYEIIASGERGTSARAAFQVLATNASG